MDKKRGSPPSPEAISRWETDGGASAKRLKRPRDPVQLGKLIGDILTGQVGDRAPTPEEQGKNPSAVALGARRGAKGGVARARKMSPAAPSASAKKAAKARWSKG